MKNQNLKNPFDNLVLDAEEQALEIALEDSELENSSHFQDTKKMFETAAKEYVELNTAKPITIRINQFDLIKVKARAKQKQIPYQTLLGSLIHQYAEGKHELSL